MSMLFEDTPPARWTPPPRSSKSGCGRDPKSGPGSCYYWWEGCSKPEKRGCYIRWFRARQAHCAALAKGAVAIYAGAC